jgi:polysaccharide chain length determinant protein (PEP-CTERM system associated)
MNQTFNDTVRVLISEAIVYRNIIVAMFAAISISMLGIGLMWTKLYSADVTIKIDQKNIIRPLMEGTAVPTGVGDIARNARELIFSRKIMAEIIKFAGWMESKPSAIEREKIIDKIKRRTDIAGVGKNLVRITYKDEDPERAQKTAQRIGELFVAESRIQKFEESKAAFEFIDKQVAEYHKKLVAAEGKLKEFRTKHLDSLPGSDADISTRINNLKDQIEKNQLELKEAEIKQASLERQLTGEAEVSISLSRETQYATRIADLQTQLETLRLSYKEDYPDIVSIRHQIEDLKQAILEERVRREKKKNTTPKNGQSYISDNVATNPLFQELRKDLSIAKTTVAALRARIRELKRRLAGELERGRSVHVSDAELAELTRGYEVNRDLYQDLLKRRERARVSRNLDRDDQGFTLSIYEPAVLPLEPTGLRFVHFAIGGIFLGLAIPIGLLIALQYIDPRVRSRDVLAEKLGLPVIGVIPVLSAPADSRELEWNVKILAAVGAGVFLLYIFIGLLRLRGFI